MQVRIPAILTLMASVRIRSCSMPTCSRIRIPAADNDNAGSSRCLRVKTTDDGVVLWSFFIYANEKITVIGSDHQEKDPTQRNAITG